MPRPSVGVTIVPVSEGVEVEIQYIGYHWWDPPELEPPTGATHFGVTVQVLIGQVGEDAADSFDLVVCSPSKLAELYDPERWDNDDVVDDVLPGGKVLPVVGMWLMRSWSREDLERALQRLIPAYSPGPDFATIAARIGRVVPWEYDYAYDAEVNREAGLPELEASFWHDD